MHTNVINIQKNNNNELNISEIYKNLEHIKEPSLILCEFTTFSLLILLLLLPGMKMDCYKCYIREF